MLNTEGIKFEYFDALDVSQGSSSIFSQYDAIQTKRKKGYVLTNAEIGCLASHRELWKKCVKLAEPILIMEDNIQINDPLQKHLDFAAQHINSLGLLKFGAIFNHRNIMVQKVDSKRRIVKYVKGACGTSCYMISVATAEQYLKHSQRFFEPVDNFMDSEWVTKQAVYTIYPDVISRSPIESVIGNRKNKSLQGINSKIIAEVYRFRSRFKQYSFNRKFRKMLNSSSLNEFAPISEAEISR